MKLDNKVLCAGLRCRALGTSAQDNQVTDDNLARYGAERGKLRTTKTILADAIRPFRKLRNEARKYFNSVTLPGISEDLRITTPARLPDLQKKIADYVAKDAALLETLKIEYEDAKDKDRLALGATYDPGLYPAVEDLANYFSITLAICDMPAGDYARIEGLGAVAQAEMALSHQQMLEQVAREARNEVRGQMTKLIQHIADKLSDPNAVKFHESTFDNLKEYLALVPDLNITNDPTLEAMRKEAQAKLNYSMAAIKDSQFLKAQAAEAAKSILASFGKIGSNRKLVA